MSAVLLQERVYTLESAAEVLQVTPFAAYCIFSSVYLEEADNLYVGFCRRIVIWSEYTAFRVADAVSDSRCNEQISRILAKIVASHAAFFLYKLPDLAFRFMIL